MTSLRIISIFGAGVAAGIINAAVGSGTLITFPVLIAFGYAPLTANVSNTVGLVPGSLSGALAYRPELRGKGRLLARLAIPSALGGLTGALLLLVLPPGVFDAVVPAFILAALALVVLGRRISTAAASWRGDRRHRIALVVALYVCAVYGGYFGAAQGIIVLALLGFVLDCDMQRANGMKNVLVMLVNLISGIAFAAEAHVSWAIAGLIASGSVIGGQLGARVARRMPAVLFRAAVVGVGTIAVIKLLLD